MYVNYLSWQMYNFLIIIYKLDVLFLSSSQTIILTLPGRLAAQWFAADELSTATSLSIFGNQMGIALSFLITPIIVKNHEDLDDIGAGLSHLFWGVAIILTVVFILIVIRKLFLRKESFFNFWQWNVDKIPS